MVGEFVETRGQGWLRPKIFRRKGQRCLSGREVPVLKSCWASSALLGYSDLFLLRWMTIYTKVSQHVEMHFERKINILTI